MLHLLLAFSAHGAIEQCVYTSSSPGAPVGDDWLVTVGDDCTGTGTCTTIPDTEVDSFDKCTPADKLWTGKLRGARNAQGHPLPQI